MTIIEYKWLLVFDNADEPQRILKYWPCSSVGSVLVTSRASMLDMNLITANCEVDSLDYEEGGSMLLSILGSTVDKTDVTTVELARKIAGELDGIALAISQMAGFILKTQMTLEKFLSLYRNKEQAEHLNSGNTSIDHFQYHHTLASVWQMSYERLSRDAYTLLRLIVFLYPDQIPYSLFMFDPAAASTHKLAHKHDEALLTFEDEIRYA
jgi:hypothetical protein